MDWDIEEVDPTSHIITVPMRRNSDWEFWLLQGSDFHWDSKWCDRELLKHQLDLCKARDGLYVCTGDRFDAMQGPHDRRQLKGETLPEFDQAEYYDLLVEEALEWFEPWVPLHAFESIGNHEEGVRKHSGTSLLRHYIKGTTRLGGKAMLGRWRGFVTIRFVDEKSGGFTRSMKVYYDHGSGGGGVVTQGVIQSQRRNVYLDVDLVWTGHVHEQWSSTRMNHRLSNTGKHDLYPTIHSCTPGYKEEYMKGIGFHAARGAPPKPVGSNWNRFYYSRRTNKIHVQTFPAEY